ncbi:MAG: carboxymuconolactone decarboxylase family protein [Candidatus Nanohaloarchaea archaeon]|nr:carboxymuconolactone decarboxylase family protein [Candidatus Nanohaloarchaea archaeon]
MDWLDDYMPKARDSFDIFRKQVYEEGDLARVEKELIAVATATVMRSEDAVAEHIDAAREHGASDEEVAASLGIAWLTTGSTQIYWMQDRYEELLDEAWYKRHLGEASKAFGDFHEEIYDNSVLDETTAELAGAAVSVVSRCPHCTESHAEQAMDAGASKQAVAEAIGVAWSVAAEAQVNWMDYDALFGE